MVIGFYEIIATIICISFVFLVYSIIQTLKQVEKTLSEVDKVVIDVRERTLRNVEGASKNIETFTEDLNNKSKKLDPAFELVSKVEHVSKIAQKGVELYKNKKNK